MSDQDLLLKVRDLSIVFGGLRAVSDFSCELRRGELAGLIGPNGAGKTTVFNMLSGVYAPTAGEILFWDRHEKAHIIGKLSPAKLNHIGIARTFQNIRLFNKLTVEDNVRIALHSSRVETPPDVVFRLKRFYHDEERMRERAEELLSLFRIDHKKHELARNLPYGEQRKLEIARALAANPLLLLLDEPAAGMNPQETEELMKLISFIRREFDVTILLIEHDMRLVMGICERLIALDYGRIIAAGAPEEIRREPAVIKAYLGEDATGDSARGDSARSDSARGDSARGDSARGGSVQGAYAQGEPVPGGSARDGQRRDGAGEGPGIMLKVAGLAVHYGAIRALRGISFEVAEGEIVTLIGSNGAGKTTTLHAISNIVKKTAGSVIFDGVDISALPPDRIVASRLIQAPEGRRIFANLTVKENLEMGAYIRPDRAALRGDMEMVFGIFPRLEERSRQIAGTLSGGEQQMLAIGRALMAAPRLLLLDEPSMGLAPILVDEIFAVIKRISEAGTTILLVEQNAFKALGIASRGYILETGQMIKSGPAKDLMRDDAVKEAYLGG